MLNSKPRVLVLGSGLTGKAIAEKLDDASGLRSGEPEATFLHRTVHLPVAPLRHPAVAD